MRGVSACKTREYRTWNGMKARCLNKNNPNYHRYGGRGITVCESWMSFSNFINDMGKCPPGMSIDRIDNNGNYCPENCRWADRKTQNRNTRRNVFIEINGEALCMLDAAKAAGLKMPVVRSRLRLGWSKRQAIGLDPPPLRGTERWVTVQGETMRLNQACRKFGISHQSFKARIGRGWSIEEAFGVKHRDRKNTKYVTYNGKRMSATEACKEAGISHMVFSSRVRQGWSIEKTLNTPVYSERTRDSKGKWCYEVDNHDSGERNT